MILCEVKLRRVPPPAKVCENLFGSGGRIYPRRAAHLGLVFGSLCLVPRVVTSVGFFFVGGAGVFEHCPYQDAMGNPAEGATLSFPRKM